MSGVSGVLNSNSSIFGEVTAEKKDSFIGNLAKKVHGIAEKVWNYINKPISLAKNTLKGIKAHYPKDTNTPYYIKVKSAISAIGCLSIINLLLKVGNIPQTTKDIIEAYLVNDKEGGIKKALSAAIDAVGALDDVGTFVTSIAALVGKAGTAANANPGVAFFAAIALPLAIVSMTAGIVMGTYNLVHQSVQLHKMCKIEDLTGYLEEKFEVKDDEYKAAQEKRYGSEVSKQFANLNPLLETVELKNYIKAISMNKVVNRASKKMVKLLLESVEDKEKLQVLLRKDREMLVLRKEHILRRQTDSKVVDYMKKLKLAIENENDDNEKEKLMNNGTSDMKKLMRRKITLEVVGLATGVTALTVLIASLIFPLMAPIVLPVVGGSSALIGFGKHIYKSHFITKGLGNATLLAA